MFFHYLENKRFRLILSFNQKSKENVKIDIDFDQINLDKYFEDLRFPNVKSESEEMIDFSENKKDSVNRYNICNRRITLLEPKTYYLPNYAVQNPIEFKELLEKIILELSEFLNDYKLILSNINLESCSKLFFKVNVFSEWSRLKFSIVKDSVNSTEFEVFMKNGYETHGKIIINIASGKLKVKAKGYASMNYNKVQKIFGVSCLSLDKTERFSLSNLISDCYTLKFYEKGKIYLLNSELDDCDNYGNEENCIIPSFPEVCTYFRSVIGSV